MLGNVMFAKLRDQLEQQRRALLIIDLRLLTQFFQNDLFRVISIKVNGVALDALPVFHIFQILYEQLIADRYVREIGHIEVKIQKNVFFYTCVSNSDTRDRDEFRFSCHMRLFRLIQQPCGQRHFVFSENIAQIFIFGDLRCNSFNNLPSVTYR